MENTKIILFLSTPKPKAEECSYRCPDGRSVTGAQTNEAPVRYFLEKYRNSNISISQIICIVTPGAREKAWEKFQEYVHNIDPAISVVDVPFEPEMKFHEEPLRAVLNKIQYSAKKTQADSILLEATGGFRDAVMQLLLISRLLDYAGVKTLEAVYSNYQNKEIVDISHLVNLFDLLGGMQELTNLGSVRTLREYYAETKDDSIRELINTTEALTDAITLCRARLIPGEDGLLARFNRALVEAESSDDPMIAHILAAFRRKFKGRFQTTNLIRWCLDSDMIQQALTVYTELIPVYLFEEKFIEMDGTVKEVHSNDYQDQRTVQFTEDFLNLSAKIAGASSKAHSHRHVETIKNLDTILEKTGYSIGVTVEEFREICRDYIYVKSIRNMTNHANEQKNALQKKMMEYLAAFKYKDPESLTTEDIRQVLINSMKRINPVTRKKKKG